MDKISSERRSENMRHIRCKDTVPEMIVRSLVYKLGFRYRLHVKDLPGRPDLVFHSRKKVIFVNGCFWHQHRGCPEGRLPGSQRAYWTSKLTRNVERDREHIYALRKSGWQVLVLWECRLKNTQQLTKTIQKFLNAEKTSKMS